MAKKLFKKGNKMARGGARPNSGPPKKELTEWFGKLANNPKVRKFVSDLATGEAIEEKVIDSPVDGQPMKVLVSAPAKVRLECIREVYDRWMGKPTQHAEIVNIKFVFDFVQKISNVINRVLSDKCPHCGHSLEFRDQTIKQLEIIAEEQQKVG